MTAAVELLAVGVPIPVRERLHDLYVENNKDLNASQVVAEAEKVSSPLHPYFEWDDTVAAQAHRLNQAQHLIRRVRVNIIQEDCPPASIRVYISRTELAITEKNLSSGSYVAIEDIAGKTMEEASLRNAIRRELLAIQRRYNNTDLVLELASELFG
jgi:hypothetical protein